MPAGEMKNTDVKKDTYWTVNGSVIKVESVLFMDDGGETYCLVAARHSCGELLRVKDVRTGKSQEYFNRDLFMVSPGSQQRSRGFGDVEVSQEKYDDSVAKRTVLMTELTISTDIADDGTDLQKTSNVEKTAQYADYHNASHNNIIQTHMLTKPVNSGAIGRGRTDTFGNMLINNLIKRNSIGGRDIQAAAAAGFKTSAAEVGDEAGDDDEDEGGAEGVDDDDDATQLMSHSPSSPPSSQSEPESPESPDLTATPTRTKSAMPQARNVKQKLFAGGSMTPTKTNKKDRLDDTDESNSESEDEDEPQVSESEDTELQVSESEDVLEDEKEAVHVHDDSTDGDDEDESEHENDDGDGDGDGDDDQVEHDHDHAHSNDEDEDDDDKESTAPAPPLSLPIEKLEKELAEAVATHDFDQVICLGQLMKEAKTKFEAEAKAKREAEEKRQAEEEKRQAEAKHQAQQKAKAERQAQQKAKREAEAKRQAEQKAKAKREAEEKRQAEEEKRQAEAKHQAQQKAKAERQAQQKAKREAEAKRQAEQKAKEERQAQQKAKQAELQALATKLAEATAAKDYNEVIRLGKRAAELTKTGGSNTKKRKGGSNTKKRIAGSKNANKQRRKSVGQKQLHAAVTSPTTKRKPNNNNMRKSGKKARPTKISTPTPTPTTTPKSVTFAASEIVDLGVSQDHPRLLQKGDRVMCWDRPDRSDAVPGYVIATTPAVKVSPLPAGVGHREYTNVEYSPVTITSTHQPAVEVSATSGFDELIRNAVEFATSPSKGVWFEGKWLTVMSSLAAIASGYVKKDVSCDPQHYAVHNESRSGKEERKVITCTIDMLKETDMILEHCHQQNHKFLATDIVILIHTAFRERDFSSIGGGQGSRTDWELFTEETVIASQFMDEAFGSCLIASPGQTKKVASSRQTKKTDNSNGMTRASSMHVVYEIVITGRTALEALDFKNANLSHTHKLADPNNYYGAVFLALQMRCIGYNQARWIRDSTPAQMTAGEFRVGAISRALYSNTQDSQSPGDWTEEAFSETIKKALNLITAVSRTGGMRERAVEAMGGLAVLAPGDVVAGALSGHQKKRKVTTAKAQAKEKLEQVRVQYNTINPLTGYKLICYILHILFT